MASYTIIPSVTKNYEDNGVLHLQLSNIHVSFVNALRRTILSDIPIVVIRTETFDTNQCTIQTNTSRFHNEIVKQRLSTIPIYTQDLDTFPTKYRLIVKAKNESDHEMLWVTTDDFQLQDKENEQFLDPMETRKIFPHDAKTDRPIDFLRLRPTIGTTINGEEINLQAEFSVATAKENGMYNVVSKCAYFNVINPEARDNLWALHLQNYKNEGLTEEEIEFEKKNFNYLDAYRCYKTDDNGDPNEFEFVIQSLGIYSNYQIAFLACQILIQKCKTFANDVESQVVPIHESKQSRDLNYTSITVSSIENSYDIILEEEDYTMGHLLCHVLYTLFYKEDQELTYVGFKKYHPHDDYSVLRMAFKDNGNAILLAKQYLIVACTQAVNVISTIQSKFKQ